MKQKLLLVSAAMLLAGSTAYAEWTRPVPASFETVQVGATLEEAPFYYLYNVQKGYFFVGANSWETRASIGATGAVVRLVDIDATGMVAINYNKRGDYVSPDGKTGIWVDGSRNDYKGWTLTEVSPQVYKIGHPTLDPDATLGCLSNSVQESPELNLYNPSEVPEGVTLYDTWSFVSEETYAALESGLQAYNAAAALDAAIKEAEAKYVGIDLAAQKAVYDNTASTKDELDAAKASIDDAITAYIENSIKSATLDNPVEITSRIPGIDGTSISDWTRAWTGAGTTGSFEVNTWSVEGNPGNDGTNMVVNFTQSWVGKGSILSDETMQRNAVKVNPGAYRITANVRCYNESGADDISGVSLFGNLNKADIKDQDGWYNTYNSMLLYWKDGFETYAVVGKDSLLTFGLSVKDANFNWVAFKDFRVFALGDAYDAVAKAAQTPMLIEAYGDDAFITTSVKEAYNDAIDAYQNGSSVEAIYAGKTAIETLSAEVKENAAAWQALVEAYNSAKELTGSGDIAGREVEDLADYLELDVQDAIDARALTTEEVKAMTETISQMRTAAVENGMKEGTDFTKELTNPDFSNGATGWSGGPTVNASCGEKYGSGTFDVYQEVQNAPVGVYEISMQGFYRQYRDDDAAVTAWYNYFDEDGEPKEVKPAVLAWVYLNDNQTPLKCVYEEPVANGEIYTGGATVDPLGQYWYPNTMSAAAEAFATGRYTVSAFGLVAKKGDSMRIGVKGDLNPGGKNNNWAIFDNFKLTYQGFKAELISPELAKAIDGLSTVGEFGSELKAQAGTLAQQGTAALASGEGKTMFDALAAIFELNSSIEASKATFVQLHTAVENLSTEIADSEASDAVKNDAIALYTKTEEMFAGDATTAEAAEAIDQIEAMLLSLKLPAGVELASDDNSVDLTALIKAPSFEKDGSNSLEGWQGTSGYNFGNNDTQKAALALEFYEKTYDMYQELKGLPNGTYKVKVSAFFRYGSTTEDFAHGEAGDEGICTMYVKAGEADAITKSVTLLSSGATTEQLSGGTTTFVKDDVTYFIPNDMVSAVSYFAAGYYKNEIIVKVTDGTLRIGIKQDEKVGAGWMIMDDWTLTYYGTESALEEGAVVTAIESVKAEGSEAPLFVGTYNLSGQKVNGQASGLVIIRSIEADGTVKVRKALVK